MIDKTTGNSGHQALGPGEHRLLNNRFSMKFPPEWEDRSYYRFEGPVEDGVKHNIIVTIENNVEPAGLQQYAELNIKALERELQTLQELKRGPVTLANKVQGYEFVYKWSPVKEGQVYQRIIYLLVNRTGYILTATFSKKTWKTLGPAINTILMSFTVT